MSQLYQRLTETLAQIHAGPLTLAEKLLLSHLYDPGTATRPVRGQTYVDLRPDRVQLQDVLGQTGMLQFMQTGRDQVALPTSIHCDHLI